MTAPHETKGVIVIGSVNIDLVMRVSHLPTAGETVSGSGFEQWGGGKGANQAVAAARLGARTWLVGATGTDSFGDVAREELAGEGVDLTYLAVCRGATGIALILVDDDGENQIAVTPGANALIDVGSVRDAVLELAEPGWAVVANLEISDSAVEAAAQAAWERGAHFILNPAPARPLSRTLLGKCRVLTPNEHEVGVLCQALGGSIEPDALLHAGAKSVIVTRGAHGAELWRGGEVLRQPPFPVTPVDTTGAGDAFTGAWAWALTQGEDERTALRSAAAAGALATQGMGARTSLPTRGELQALMARHPIATPAA